MTAEGYLQLRKADRWYHFIKNGDNEWEIPCGAEIDVKLIQPGLWTMWLPGRYEARLTEPVEAYMTIGEFHPGCQQARITVPLGTMIRINIDSPER
jgi:hypothetical protein